jgi:hypothetical protein
MLAGDNTTAAIPFGSLRPRHLRMVETVIEIEPPAHEAQEETHEVVR